MATINYLLKGSANPSTIYMRFKNGRNTDLSASLPYKVDKSEWSKSKQSIKKLAGSKSKDAINQDLLKLRPFIIDELNQDLARNKIIDKNWLRSKIRKYFNHSENDDDLSIYFESFAQHFINNIAPNRLMRTSGNPTSPETIHRYKYTLKQLQDYQSHRNTRLTYSDLSISFCQDFINYCITVKKYHNNTINDFIKNFKVFANQAKIYGHKINPEIESSEFSVPSKETKNTYLNESEIEQLLNLDLSSNKKLEKVRDTFIIACWTGLRISDFSRIDSIDLSKKLFIIKQHKTKKNIVIPIHPHVRGILEKYNGEMPDKISSQNFNKYIKEVCQQAGIDEETEGGIIDSESKRKKYGLYPKYMLISSHTGRRSFATNMYEHFPIHKIMAITGHKSEKTFLNYIKKPPQDHANDILASWEETYKATNSNLKIVS